ncbi:hypothetical protein DACRYDRAFT_62996 [Dacryopinax primogenitus]|uniref:Ribosomal RNA-processing protein 8 n=1 Tax=Dacryopinax primogenitus (strain DJM 731) TaxID=1858805 RepID=M5G7R6_DACPD|nr:uncharacterized protein DACRYDRAFT_62996 [Dacryopinax primogenitus]EJU04794.1 hypothetical protein DACRYDRAFT_62996 [Dacryopinax primogenitus]
MKQMHEEDVKGAKDKQEKKEKWENKKNQGKTREREGEKERMGKKGGEGGRNTPMGKGQKDVPNQKSTPNIRTNSKLTPLQAKMKASLSGARFRWINEQLYTSSASSAHELMRSQPNLYEDYHAGFAAQLVGWPTPPLDALAVLLQKLPKTALIADLGSGPGTLAKKLVPQGRKVLSFDLHPDDWVTEADFCERIPLPGSEGEESGAIVDACVCCLSLMGTDWICGVREARRVLVANGQLLVAEVTSRFTDVSNFVQVIESVGFRMTKKDDGDTHFMLFVFEKVDKDLEEWEEVVQRAEGLLKPCEYKRR